MSGFQIPGLGHAKPDEKLPPLPADQAVGASSATPEPSKDVEITDAAPESTKHELNDDQMQDQMQDQTQAPVDHNAPESTKPETNDEQMTEQKQAPVDHNADSEAMVVDQPESPPSLTGALEAALGGLQGDNAEQVLAQSSAAQAPAQQSTEEQAGQGEHPEWEMDSSPYASSSDTTSSDESSSDEDSDNEGYELLGVEETARLLMEAEGGSDDEGDKGKSSAAAQLRTKNELPEESIPRPDVTITAEMKMEELGLVEHIVENMILIKAFTPGEYQVLDTGSVLCNADRTVLGAVAETIGKVIQPMYTMRFNSEDEIRELGIEVGTEVFYPVDHASFVFTEPLKNLKGSDASNLHDEEVGDEEMEFSDDEKEAEYKRSLKEKKRKKAAASGRGGRDQPHPLRQEIGAGGELNYDDDDGPYKPLTRPPGFGNGPVSQETYEPSPRPNFRGRGRGDSRGRGNRGRGSNRGGGRGGGGDRGPPRDGYSLPPQGSPQYPQQPQHQQAPPPPPPGWNPQQQGSAPAMPNFGFQFPGWPQQPPAGQSSAPVAPPPPPPGWPGSPQAQGQAAGGGANFMNPALLAALMSHMQGQQQQQQQWQQPGGQGQ